MHTFLTKTAMLIMFLLAVTFAWAAITMVFSVSLYNILLGVLSAFFLLRAFELADRINKLGPYADPDEKDKDMSHKPGPHDRRGPMFGEGSSEEEDAPDEE